MTNAEEKIPAFIRNEFFYAFARLCMIVVTVVGLPAAGYVGNRIITQNDAIREQVQQQNIALILLTSEVKFRFANVEDHEHRLRKLELGSAR